MGEEIGECVFGLSVCLSVCLCVQYACMSARMYVFVYRCLPECSMWLGRYVFIIACIVYIYDHVYVRMCVM